MANDQHDTDPMVSRHQAWKDSLSRDHLRLIEQVEGMPPEMAMQFMWVDLDAKIEELRKPLWRRVGATLGIAIGGAVAYLAGSDGPRFGS